MRWNITLSPAQQDAARQRGDLASATSDYISLFPRTTTSCMGFLISSKCSVFTWNRWYIDWHAATRANISHETNCFQSFHRVFQYGWLITIECSVNGLRWAVSPRSMFFMAHSVIYGQVCEDKEDDLVEWMCWCISFLGVPRGCVKTLLWLCDTLQQVGMNSHAEQTTVSCWTEEGMFAATRNWLLYVFNLTYRLPLSAYLTCVQSNKWFIGELVWWKTFICASPQSQKQSQCFIKPDAECGTKKQCTQCSSM